MHRLPLGEQKEHSHMSEQALVAATVNSWKLVADRTDKFFSGKSEEQLQAEVAPGKNRLIYLWGHLVAVHDRMFPLLRLQERLHPEFDEPFLTNPDRATPQLPAGPAIKKAWDEVNRTLLEGFSGFSAPQWLERHGSVSPEDFAKDPSRNRLAILLSRTNHISFHLGQTALIGKGQE
jgi:DinB superfamily